MENERDETYIPSNPHIDLSRTRRNYHEVVPYGSYMEIINKRIAELGIGKPRKDAVLMCSIIVGSDGKFFSGLNDNEREAFFFEATQYFAEHYGRENIISAVVHMDETNPHLHLNLIPVINGRLCAKRLFDRKALIELQTNFWKEFGEHWGLMRGKSGSQAVHLSTAEYKAMKIIEQAEQRAAERERQQDQEYARKESEMKAMDERKAREEKEIEAMSTQKESLSKDIAELTDVHDAVEEAKFKPIPKKKKEVAEEITTLRTENAAYREEIRIKTADNSSLFQQLQEAQRKDTARDTAFSMVSDMLATFPEEFDALLAKARRQKSTNPQRTPNKNKGSGETK